MSQTSAGTPGPTPKRGLRALFARVQAKRLLGTTSSTDPTKPDSSIFSPRPPPRRIHISTAKDAVSPEFPPLPAFRERSSAISGPTARPRIRSLQRSTYVPKPRFNVTRVTTPAPRKRRQTVFSPQPRPPLSVSPQDDIEDINLKVRPNLDYTYYIRKRQQLGQSLGAYEDYDPFGRRKGQHQEFGRRKSTGSMSYPWSTTTRSRRQSFSGYTADHPSEEYLPRVQNEFGRTAVYGAHRDRPLYGPENWDEFSQNGMIWGIDMSSRSPHTWQCFPMRSSFARSMASDSKKSWEAVASVRFG